MFRLSRLTSAWMLLFTVHGLVVVVVVAVAVSVVVVVVVLLLLLLLFLLSQAYSSW